ncbi:MAG: hypothetical protein RLZZ203_2544, partial [Cyanobacteriota bacterium]
MTAITVNLNPIIQLSDHQELSGEDVLSDFVLNMEIVWE